MLDSPAQATLVQGLEAARGLIDSIDLSMVKRKLLDRDEGVGWSEEHVAFVEERYRRYLLMIYIDRDASNVPTKDVDTFWHQHILDTRAYADDCARVFGEFIHHYPYFGMHGDEDAKNLEMSFEATRARYASLFGEEYYPCGDGDTAAAKCSSCKGKPTCNHGPGKCGQSKCDHPWPKRAETLPSVSVAV